MVYYLQKALPEIRARVKKIGEYVQSTGDQRCQSGKMPSAPMVPKTHARPISDTNASRIARIAVAIRPLVLTPGESMVLI